MFFFCVTTLLLSSSSFQAGFGSAPLTPDEPVPLAGYADGARRLDGAPNLASDRAWTMFEPSTGVHDDVEATAMVLDVDGARYAFVGVDLIGVDAAAVVAIAREVSDLGYSAERMVIGASHTHSGPGAVSKAAIWQALALDLYKERIALRVVTQTALAIRNAHASLAPAKLAVGSVTVGGLIGNRRHLDELTQRLVVVRVDDASGTPKGVLYNFPIHGTSLGPTNLELSADNIGYARRAIARKLGVTAVYLNGAEGDVSPMLRDFDGAEALGERLSDAAVLLHASLAPSASLDFSWSARAVRLPPTTLHLAACDPAIAEHLTSSLQLPFQLSESEALLRAWRFGDRAFVTMPGEAITRLGQSIEARVRSATGASEAVVIGLANGYAGYMLDEAEYERGGYESCASTYGKSFGPWLADEVVYTAAKKGPPPIGIKKCTDMGVDGLALAWLPLLRRRRRR